MGDRIPQTQSIILHQCIHSPYRFWRPTVRTVHSLDSRGRVAARGRAAPAARGTNGRRRTFVVHERVGDRYGRGRRAALRRLVGTNNRYGSRDDAAATARHLLRSDAKEPLLRSWIIVHGTVSARIARGRARGAGGGAVMPRI